MKQASTARIRPYRNDDEQALIQLWHDCGLVRPQNDPALDITLKLAVQPELLLVAEQGAQVVGSVMAGYEGHRGWINYLAVAPACRRSGLGLELMRHAEACLSRLGCPKINLQVRKSNTEVIAFYAKAGLVEDQVVSMGKRLAPSKRL